MSTPADEFNFPIVMTPNGLQPQAPASLLTQLLAAVATTNPGYTANLPGSLIEDVSSTDVAAIALCDQAKVELVNSLTPNGANIFLLTQLGQIYGVQLGQPTNTNVLVTFAGTVGYVIANGVLVSDGTNVFQIQGGGVIGNGGFSAPINAISVNSGSFSVPANTVTQILTSIPASITLSVTNTLPGNPGGSTETYFRLSRARAAGRARGKRRYLALHQDADRPDLGLSVQSHFRATGDHRPSRRGGRQWDPLSDRQCDLPGCGRCGDIGGLGGFLNSARNVTVSLLDYPDTYNILYVAAPLQTVTMTITWNTVLTSFTGGGAFPGLVQGPLAAYINSLGDRPGDQ